MISINKLKNPLLTILFFSLLCSCSSVKNSSANLKSATVSLEGTHFKRTNLLISDLAKSLTIYRDILGFTVHKVSESNEDSYSYPVFNIPKEAKLKFCTLDSPDQIRTIALTEITGIVLPPPPSSPRMSASVIRVKDLPGTMKKIEALGLEITKPKIAVGSDGNTFLEQAFVDFDGHLIVLYEFQKS